MHFARRLARVCVTAPPERCLLRKSNSTLTHPGANGGAIWRFKKANRLEYDEDFDDNQLDGWTWFGPADG